MGKEIIYIKKANILANNHFAEKKTHSKNKEKKSGSFSKGKGFIFKTHLPADPARQILNDQAIIGSGRRPILVQPYGTSAAITRVPTASTRAAVAATTAASGAPTISVATVRSSASDFNSQPLAHELLAVQFVTCVVSISENNYDRVGIVPDGLDLARFLPVVFELAKAKSILQ